MAHIARQSVKIEFGNIENEKVEDLMFDALAGATERMFGDDPCEETLTSHFFTVRFDRTDIDGIAATVTAAEKRG